MIVLSYVSPIQLRSIRCTFCLPLYLNAKLFDTLSEFLIVQFTSLPFFFYGVLNFPMSILASEFFRTTPTLETVLLPQLVIPVTPLILSPLSSILLTPITNSSQQPCYVLRFYKNYTTE